MGSKQECKVFIGGLSWETTGEKLRAYFENYGAVREAFVSYNRNNGRPRGFGFVVFESPEIADKVVASKHTVDRREVEAKRAVPKDENAAAADAAGGAPSTDAASGAGGGGVAATGGGGGASQKTRKIFVGGLAPGVDDAELRRHFEQFGDVDDAVVMHDHDNKRPRGFGFVSFSEDEAVDRVFAVGPVQSILDKQIEIKPAVPRDQMPGRALPTSSYYHHHQPPPFMQQQMQQQQMKQQQQGGMAPQGPYGTPARPFGYASHMAPPGGFPQPYNHLRAPPPGGDARGAFLQQQAAAASAAPHSGSGGPARPYSMPNPSQRPQQPQQYSGGSAMGSSSSNSMTGVSPGASGALHQAVNEHRPNGGGGAYAGRPSGQALPTAQQQAAAAAVAAAAVSNGYGGLYNLANGGGAMFGGDPQAAAALYLSSGAFPQQHLNGGTGAAGGGGGNKMGGGVSLGQQQQHNLHSSLSALTAGYSPYSSDPQQQPHGGGGGGGSYEEESAYGVGGADSAAAAAYAEQVVSTGMAGLSVGGRDYTPFTSANQMGSGWSH